MTEITKDFENLKIQGLDKKIKAIFDKYSRQEQESKKPKVVPPDVGKRWKARKLKKEKAKEEAEEERLLRSITKMYGYDEDEEGYFGDVDSGFGKKQKKDIKGMLKKILLYGGIPTLLVVSLGVLSNTKLKGNKQKTKVKKSVGEQIFKNKFVNNIKKIIEEKYKNKRNKDTSQLQSELSYLKYSLKENLDTKQRQGRRNASINSVLFLKSINISPRKLRRNNQNNTKEPTTIRKEPKTKLNLETIKLRMEKNPPSQVEPNTYIKISKKKDIFNYVKKSERPNVKIDKDDKVWVKQKNVWTLSKNYSWNPKNEMITFLRGGGEVINIPLKYKKE